MHSPTPEQYRELLAREATALTIAVDRGEEIDRLTERNCKLVEALREIAKVARDCGTDPDDLRGDLVQCGENARAALREAGEDV